MENQEPIKTCLNCGYRDDETCLRSGFNYTITRTLSKLMSEPHCNQYFSGWAPKPKNKSCFQRLKALFS